MKYAEIVLAVAAFGTGLLAAWYWLKASKATADTGWGRNGLVEPGVHSMAQDAWIGALLQSTSESSRLNKIAVRWTAVTVVLTGIVGLMAAAKN